MKFLIITLALLGAVTADVSHLGSSQYLPPVEGNIQPDYLPPPVPAPVYGAPPVIGQALEYGPPSVGQPAEQYGLPGLPQPASEYIPPAPPAPTYIPPAPPAPAYIPPPQPAPKYIPPLPVTPEYIPPAPPAPKYIPPAEVPAPVFESNNDGYKYRTVKRVIYRNRS